MRQFCYMIMSAALLTGCQLANIEQDVLPEEGIPVSFSAYSGKAATKAQLADWTTLTDKGFLMYANVNVPGVSDPQPFMNAQKMVYTNSAWTYAPTKYWPTTEGATVDFYPRYTDGSDNVNITYDWNNIPQVIFYVNNTVSKQTDFLWAAPVLGAEREDYVNKSVQLQFKHALTSFFFTIQLAASYPNTTVKVKSVTLEGYFAPKATLNVNETDVTKAWSLQGDWGKRTYRISCDADADEEVTYKAAVTGLTSGGEKIDITGNKGRIMVLPFDNTEYTVTLEYEITVNDGTSDPYTSTNSVSYTKKNETLKPGYEIVSNLVLTLDPVYFNATLEAFSKVDVDL